MFALAISYQRKSTAANTAVIATNSADSQNGSDDGICSCPTLFEDLRANVRRDLRLRNNCPKGWHYEYQMMADGRVKKIVEIDEIATLWITPRFFGRRPIMRHSQCRL